VKADLAGWLAKVRPGGLVIADDYRNASQRGGGGIRACREVLAEQPVKIEAKLGSRLPSAGSNPAPATGNRPEENAARI
jgi:hypothetical protein